MTLQAGGILTVAEVDVIGERLRGVESAMVAGFAGLHQRLDAMAGTTAGHGQRIEALERNCELHRIGIYAKINDHLRDHSEEEKVAEVRSSMLLSKRQAWALVTLIVSVPLFEIGRVLAAVVKA